MARWQGGGFTCGYAGYYGMDGMDGWMDRWMEVDGMDQLNEKHITHIYTHIRKLAVIALSMSKDSECA